jgi:hypothetical protein
MKTFEAIEQDALNSPVQDIKWYGKEDQTDDQSIHDSGSGEAVVIRLFEFQFKPGIKTPVKEELLTPEYLKQVDIQLWGDGLRRVMEPRTHITKEGCKIFVPCVAATGQSHLEAPKLLQEWI